MIVTTTPAIDGKTIKAYKGIVAGEAIMGANAVVGVDIDYEVVREGMLMVTASGTAVVV